MFYLVLSLGTRDQYDIAPVLGILIGIVTALLLVTIIILGALKVRAAQREGSHASRPGFLPVKEKVTLPLRSESEDLFEKDDKNPDVVPANKGMRGAEIMQNRRRSSSRKKPPRQSCSCRYKSVFISADSDYQLGSAVQTPGLNNALLTTGNDFEGQRITPLSEAYIARDRAYQPQHVGIPSALYTDEI